MERAPQNLPNTSSRLVAMAVRLLGSRSALQARLRWSDEQLELYSSGRGEPSFDEFAGLVSLIVDEQRAVIEKNRVLLSEIGTRGRGASSAGGEKPARRPPSE